MPRRTAEQVQPQQVIGSLTPTPGVNKNAYKTRCPGCTSLIHLPLPMRPLPQLPPRLPGKATHRSQSLPKVRLQSIQMASSNRRPRRVRSCGPCLGSRWATGPANIVAWASVSAVPGFVRCAALRSAAWLVYFGTPTATTRSNSYVRRKNPPAQFHQDRRYEGSSLHRM